MIHPQAHPITKICTCTVFPWILPADTINLSHQNNADTIWGQILFGGGHYYFNASGDTTLVPSDGAEMRVDTSCGPGVDLYSFFPTCTGVSPLVLGPDPDWWSSRASLLTASPTTWPQLFEWVGVDTIRGRILFAEIRYMHCPLGARGSPYVGIAWNKMVAPINVLWWYHCQKNKCYHLQST